MKPPLSPPPLAFPVAWTILYALMGIDLARVVLCEGSSLRTAAILLYAAQLLFNLAWCFIFFSYQKFGLALGWLIVLLILVVIMTITFSKLDTLAWKLQLPYLLWLCFATYLNAGVVVMN